ncbi:hypothetical protein RHMOL_Rhmol11G0211100 [Rhododendron molle]|uniref:Uncharacterized protein n=1 Tax=Rhododendron molle TaxID=49168 RepID=A0ACC0LUP4_RHOML|nr:hypothetical protein RHMOL_Rhmol11G0211100 [Rhododendron molle]
MACTSGSQSPSSSSFSSNPQLIKGRYDIFLSFRGLDTRKKFTDHLYHALMREGFQTFRDDDEIDKGEDIKFEMRKAIRNSWMSVIVLSENYANSMSCLFELQTILELCKKSDHFVLPVFYEVEPEVLKEQSKNLVFERKEATVERVKGWNAALKEVAGSRFGNWFQLAVIKVLIGILSIWLYRSMNIPTRLKKTEDGLGLKKKKEKEKKKKKKKKKKKFKQLLKKQKNDVLK